MKSIACDYCGKVVGYNSYFGRYICNCCGEEYETAAVKDIEPQDCDIDILGAEYNFRVIPPEQDARLTDNDGICSLYDKIILINDRSGSANKDETESERGAILRKVKRHEILHAFLFESGLDVMFLTPTEQEIIVDWFAVQFPKIASVFKKLKIDEYGKV